MLSNNESKKEVRGDIEKKAYAIPEQLVILHKRVEEIVELVNALEVRVSPVMYGGPLGGDGEEKKQACLNVPVADEIHKQNIMLGAIHSKIQSILERLEL